MKFDAVLNDIKPSRKTRKTVLALANLLIRKIRIPGTKAVIGGSFAKDTWLNSTRDIDIYVKFDYKRYHKHSEAISDILEKALKKHFRFSRLHGSRDYFQIRHGEYMFEIVPILNITRPEQALNITDFSSFHVNYVRKHKKLADDIRLAKAFAKAQDVYGAESYIRGFSGYALELLVIKHGSLLNLIKSASKWEPKVIIGSRKSAERLSWAKKVSPLILIDPVQPDRNAAAALSDEKFWVFVQACKKFLKKPSEELFAKQPIDMERLKKLGKVIAVNITPLKGKEDVVGAKALKAFEYIKSQITRREFLLKFAHFQFEEKTRFYFVVNNELLGEFTVAVGPPVNMKEHYEDFLKKHPESEVEDGRAIAHVKRDFRSITGLIEHLIRDQEVASRVQEASYEVLE